MVTISGFTFIHNALDSGYPIIEAIRAVQPYVDEVLVVDMQSTDGTRELLEKLNYDLGSFRIPKGVQFSNTIEVRPLAIVKIIDGHWGNTSGQLLDTAYREYIKCLGDIIIHFEADEVYDDKLIAKIRGNILAGYHDIAVYRIQLEQNFQRCKWYPELVHRVWRKDSHTQKAGHTSNRHNEAFEMGPKSGYLWDISNCFRDNFLKRIENMAKYRQEENNYLIVPQHVNLDNRPDRKEVELRLGERHWTWTHTPFDIPEILKPLVGMTEYKPEIR